MNWLKKGIRADGVVLYRHYPSRNDSAYYLYDPTQLPKDALKFLAVDFDTAYTLWQEYKSC